MRPNSRNRSKEDSERRIYFSYGYPKTQLDGPYRLPLSQKDKNRIRQLYLDREFILSSTTVTIQSVPPRHSHRLLDLPFNSELVDKTKVSNVPILQCDSEMYQFAKARTEQAKATISWYLRSECIVGMLLLLVNPIAMCTCFHNLQIASFWRDSSAKLFIVLNIAYSFAFCLYPIVTRPRDYFPWIVFCCLSLIFGPFLWLMFVIFISIRTEVIKIIGDDTHQMERDIAYFILNDDCISSFDTHSQGSHDNWKLLTNASCRILNVMMDYWIMEHLTNNNDENDYKRGQMRKFETECQINAECLFDYHCWDEIVKKTNKFNHDIPEEVDKYFKFMIKMFLVVTSVCFISNYVILIFLYLDETVLMFLYCRIISDTLILVFYIPYILYREYHIYMQLVKYGGLHWLESTSLEYFCHNQLDKNYGMKFIFNFICDYCCFIDIYMNNYITCQMFFAFQEMNELNEHCLLNFLSDDILYILIRYLWDRPRSKNIRKNREHYMTKVSNGYGLSAGSTKKELKTMVMHQHRNILEKLNQLTLMKKYYASFAVDAHSESTGYQTSQNKNQTTPSRRYETYDVLPQNLDD